MAKKEYNYIYDEGRLVRATENTITLNGEMVTGRTVVNTVRYKYNSDGQMTSMDTGAKCINITIENMV